MKLKTSEQEHPAWRPLIFDWFVNSFVMVVYEKIVWSCFEQKILTEF